MSFHSLKKFPIHFAFLIFATIFIPSTSAVAAEPSQFSFALLGDVPYHDGEVLDFERMLGEISGENVSFVVHVGDFKSGSSRCSDALFLNRKEMFNKSVHPFIYVPGDNEWTDCHRKSNGAYIPAERLNKLREIFFVDQNSLGKNKIALTHQSDAVEFKLYRENTRWVQSNVLFVALNVPGSSNNTGRTAADDEEARLRSLANHAWIKQAFELAKKQNMPAVMFLMQADPLFEYGSAHQGLRGYIELLDLLREQSLAFSGQVVLVHGDTHFYRVDKPLRDFSKGERIKNFTRVEVFGSPAINWVRVRVDTSTANVFQFTSGR
jgi:predicted phosphodiesterase